MRVTKEIHNFKTTSIVRSYLNSIFLKYKSSKIYITVLKVKYYQANNVKASRAKYSYYNHTLMVVKLRICFKYVPYQ